ncbi:MAG: tetratricopeptide repeat protein, partial [Planctomycetaceae bacterium]|nr:tetratricopeptide repeat protein [Planctomycetaceae bacterium]
MNMVKVRSCPSRNLPKPFRCVHFPDFLTGSDPLLFPSTGCFPRPNFFLLILALSFLHLLPKVFAEELSEAEALFQSGKYAECIALTGKEIEDGDFSETWRELRIESQLASGRYPDALKSLEEALRRYEESIRLRWLGCKVYRLNGQSETAATQLAEIKKRFESSPYRYRNALDMVVLGKYYLDQGEDAKTILDSIYKKVQQDQPRIAEGFTAAGELALTKQDFGLAAAQYEKAVKLDPDDPAIHFALAQAY